MKQVADQGLEFRGDYTVDNAGMVNPIASNSVPQLNIQSSSYPKSRILDPAQH